MMPSITPLFFAALFFAAPPASSVQPSAALAAKVDALFAPVAGGKLPGAAVAIVQDGRVVLMKGYGMADVEKNVPITPGAIFRLASVTKSFTAVATLQLHERGKLNIEDPVSKYLPDFTAGANVRIAHLLTHTAGVPDFISIEEAKKRPLEFTPGSRISYSNSGYQLLGLIIEKASGKRWEECLRENIFQPLGMKHTGWDRSSELPGRATGYLLGKDGAYEPVQAQDAAGAFAAGGLYSTVEDMVRWDEGLAKSKVLKRKTLELAFSPGLLTDGRRTVYGMGFIIGKHGGLREIGHGGDITGFNTWIARYPERDFAVVVLSNTGMRPPGPLPTASDLAHRIVELYLADYIEKPQQKAPVQLSAAALDSWVGRYEFDAPETVIQQTGRYLTITREGERLIGQDKNTKLPLEAQSQTVFQSPGAPIVFTFVRGEEGKATEVIVTVMGLREFRAKRVD
ncbi:MAG TPA: serine hydrolase domain-containing protein [Bryobacteraceae bacterium]|nr:serine hydrolase domain-containing protein [Bryobacteraceae bacterium]